MRGKSGGSVANERPCRGKSERWTQRTKTGQKLTQIPSLCLRRGETSHVRTELFVRTGQISLRPCCSCSSGRCWLLLSTTTKNILHKYFAVVSYWCPVGLVYIAGAYQNTRARTQYWINLLNSIYAKTQLYWEFNGTRMEAVFSCISSSGT